MAAVLKVRTTNRQSSCNEGRGSQIRRPRGWRLESSTDRRIERRPEGRIPGGHHVSPLREHGAGALSPGTARVLRERNSGGAPARAGARRQDRRAWRHPLLVAGTRGRRRRSKGNVAGGAEG